MSKHAHRTIRREGYKWPSRHATNSTVSVSKVAMLPTRRLSSARRSKRRWRQPEGPTAVGSRCTKDHTCRQQSTWSSPSTSKRDGRSVRKVIVVTDTTSSSLRSTRVRRSVGFSHAQCEKPTFSICKYRLNVSTRRLSTD